MSQTVLVVDDEEGVRNVVARMLKRLGYESVLAANGDEAVRLFSERPRDIVCAIVDLTMPGLDGEATLFNLKAIREDLPVVLASGNLERDLEDCYDGCGFAGYIQKPFTVAVLDEKLRKILGSAPS